MDIETGRLIFEWRSLDHVQPDGKALPLRQLIRHLTYRLESVIPISSLAFGTGHNSSDAIDYFHINSVAKDSQTPISSQPVTPRPSTKSMALLELSSGVLAASYQTSQVGLVLSSGFSITPALSLPPRMEPRK